MRMGLFGLGGVVSREDVVDRRGDGDGRGG
jgi:hypothetical protein